MKHGINSIEHNYLTEGNYVPKASQLRASNIKAHINFKTPEEPKSIMAKTLSAQASPEPSKRFKKETFTRKKFHSMELIGPKASSLYISSKSAVIEDSPIPEEEDKFEANFRERIFFQDHDWTEEPGFSMQNLYNTNLTQLAKEEDRFWRYEREEKFVGKIYPLDSQIDIKEVNLKDPVFKEKSEQKKLKKLNSILKQSTKQFSRSLSKKSVSFDHKVKVKKFMKQKSRFKRWR